MRRMCFVKSHILTLASVGMWLARRRRQCKLFERSKEYAREPGLKQAKGGKPLPASQAQGQFCRRGGAGISSCTGAMGAHYVCEGSHRRGGSGLSTWGRSSTAPSRWGSQPAQAEQPSPALPRPCSRASAQSLGMRQHACSCCSVARWLTPTSLMKKRFGPPAPQHRQRTRAHRRARLTANR